VRAPIVLGHRREGDVVDVEVEAHADGVGGDEEVDFAGLIKFGLCVARARRKRAEHDGCAAPLPANEFSNRVD